jgi:hypothetical protein
MMETYSVIVTDAPELSKLGVFLDQEGSRDPADPAQTPTEHGRCQI